MVAIVICVAIIDGGMKNRNLFNLGKIRIVDNFLIAVEYSAGYLVSCLKCTELARSPWPFWTYIFT